MAAEHRLAADGVACEHLVPPRLKPGVRGTAMNEITRLQEWYASQCNGEWEHRYGISITSCDNPGWWVKIDLAGTSLETKSLAPVARNVDPGQLARIAGGLEPDRCDRGGDWMLCEIKNKVFEGAGDPEKLQAILETFLNWAIHE